ncbi:helix-turn-helix transcriptional regulator, partial [Dankookia rubra]|uniref:helix-turn-helix transcriptional regulator n=1 Tax=Dankookia rubra TaxID=1442381 RepID=UPI0019D52097
LPRPSGRAALSVLVAPLRRAASAGAWGEPAAAAALLVLTDPERRHEPPAALVARLHNLPRAEAELVLGLLAGRDLKAAAEGMGITLNTAKTLLQRAFERTGTHRQAELLTLVLRGPAGAALPGPTG